MDKMKAYRDRIDKLDDIILSALEERFSIAEEVGVWKKRQGLPLQDVKREEEIYDRISAYRHSDVLKKVYATVLAESRRLQE